MNNNSITFKVTNQINSGKVKFRDLEINDIFIEGTGDDFDTNSNGRNNSNNNQNKKVIATSINKELKYIGYNSFVMSAIEAYSNHLDLIIRPEDIWCAIITQFSIYVEKNSSKLRDKFIVSDSGSGSGSGGGNSDSTTLSANEKKKLVVYTNYPILKAPIDKLTLDMANEIEKNIKDPSIKNWIVPSFSTTTLTDRVVFSASLMSVTKGYFTFEYQTLCGLSNVTLLGTVDDWVNLKERVQRLKEFNLPESSSLSFFSKLFSSFTNSNNNSSINNNNKDNNQMNKWVSLLNPVLDKFIESSRGNPDIEWWNKIAHKKSRSGSNNINGWITVFCVYDCQSNWLGDNFEKGETLHFDSEPLNTKNPWLQIPFSSISRGYLDVPIILKDSDGSTFNSTLYSGHIGASFKDNSKIKPSLDWCLVLN